ncbi:hypothetical protein BpHYR1_043244 [Brachionus plicatilis]|uniref:Uncharacterized protein n=1 Tax=Brachionus plicatilis TaxID=10195 RepID=A0A3M7R2R6_BRAPC|nr:hypothetical protein BpHYR1_043244 [Brachionus plicatilis]
MRELNQFNECKRLLLAYGNVTGTFSVLHPPAIIHFGNGSSEWLRPSFQSHDRNLKIKCLYILDNN